MARKFNSPKVYDSVCIYFCSCECEFVYFCLSECTYLSFSNICLSVLILLYRHLSSELLEYAWLGIDNAQLQKNNNFLIDFFFNMFKPLITAEWIHTMQVSVNIRYRHLYNFKPAFVYVRSLSISLVSYLHFVTINFLPTRPNPWLR